MIILEKISLFGKEIGHECMRKKEWGNEMSLKEQVKAGV